MPRLMRLRSEKSEKMTNEAAVLKFVIRHSNFAIFFPRRVLAHPGYFVPYFTIFPGPLERLGVAGVRSADCL